MLQNYRKEKWGFWLMNIRWFWADIRCNWQEIRFWV